MPSRRSALVAATIVAVAVGGYVLARTTPLFAIRTIDVEGASPVLAARVRTALASLHQTNLVAFDATQGQRLVATVPMVASAHFDRAFPSTLRVVVNPERPAALLRRGRDAWVVSRRGRVLSRVRETPFPDLPRVWLPPTSEPLVGAMLSEPAVETVRALVQIASVRLPVKIRSAKVVEGELSLDLASGVRVVLGAPVELRLKMAVLARVLRVTADARVIDASVPERVVAGPGAR